MEMPLQYLLFRLAEWWCALPLAVVERVLPAGEITPLPEAPLSVSGVVNLAGEIVPVFALRRRFGLPDRPVKLSDKLVVAHTHGQPFARRVALLTDEVSELVTVEAAVVLAEGQKSKAQGLVPGLRVVSGVVSIADELVILHDLDAFLSAADDVALTAALQQMREQEP